MAFRQDNAKIATTLPKVYGIDAQANILLPHVNLDNEGKKKLKLQTFEDEPQYISTKKDDEGNEYQVVTIELYYKVVSSTLEEFNDHVETIRFYVENREQPMSKAGNYQYINLLGESSWLESEDAETKWMSSKEGIRVALKGEVDFMNALRQMTGLRTGIDVFNWKKIFAGDFTELRQTIKDALAYLKEKNKVKKFSVLYYIKEYEKEDENGEVKTLYIQSKYIRGFTPNTIRKNIQNSEENGYPLKGFYKKDGVLTNYLTVFNIEDFKNAEDDTVDDLPF